MNKFTFSVLFLSLQLISFNVFSLTRAEEYTLKAIYIQSGVASSADLLIKSIQKPLEQKFDRRLNVMITGLTILTTKRLEIVYDF